MANPITQIIITAVDKTKAAFASAKGGMDSIGNSARSLMSIFAGLGVGLSVAGLVGSVKRAAEEMDAVRKSAQAAGTSVEKFSAISYAAGQSGVDDLQGGLAKLARNLDEAKSGTGEAAEAFARLQIDPKQFNDPADALLVLADRFASMPDGVNKTALAMAIFGKAGADLIPLLNQGSAGIRALMEEAGRLGLVLDDETTKAAEQFNDSLDKLSKRASGAGISLANELLPSLNQYVSALDDVIERGSAIDRIKFFGAGYISEDVLNRITDAGQRVAEYDQKIQELTQHLKERQDVGVAGPIEVLQLKNLIAEYTKTRNEIAAADKKANDARAKSAKDTAVDVSDEYRSEAKAFKESIKEQISDAGRLQSALQSAYTSARDEQKKYEGEAQSLRDKAARPVSDNQDQSSIRADATFSAMALERIKANGDPEQIRAQADAVRELAEQLDDKEYKTWLLQRADLAQTAAADKSAVAAGERADGLAAQMDANTARMAAYKDSLAGLDKPISLDVVPTENTNKSLADLTEIKRLMDHINANPVKVSIESSGAGGVAGDLRTAALKHGRRG